MPVTGWTGFDDDALEEVGLEEGALDDSSLEASSEDEGVLDDSSLEEITEETSTGISSTSFPQAMTVPDIITKDKIKAKTLVCLNIPFILTSILELHPKYIMAVDKSQG